jgi:predicted pyridoxine 5'-phosphate oxidase superfamily flavin-nucleotide-binding protein
MTYHEGELEMQRRADVEDLAARVGRIIAETIPAAIAAFLADRTFAVAASVDDTGAPRATLLRGRRGFLEAVDPHTLVVTPASEDTDRVATDLAAPAPIGLIAIDFATRRRVRVNGLAQVKEKQVHIRTREVYSNCPQYIHVQPAQPESNGTWQEWVTSSDTFFIATAHPTRGADASHRGGPSGFAHIDSRDHLSWTDYSGNNMFNTLGNLVVEPRCALLFIDFQRARTLELRGRAIVDGTTDRQVRVEIDEVSQTAPTTVV